MSFNNERLDWGDLALFLAVARAGSLAQAAQQTGVSAPTLSRRLAGLEAALGQPLFDRLPTGLAPTTAGRELQARIDAMDTHAQAIQSWRENMDPRPIVRIASGLWTSVFLARHADRLALDGAGPRVELLSGAGFLNLLKREADIAIRNRTPEQQGLRRKRLGTVGFAVFGAPAYLRGAPQAYGRGRYQTCRWVLSSPGGSTGRSAVWLRDRIGPGAALTCDAPQALLEATRAGAGLSVLPCFVGAHDPGLVQCSDPIEELRHVQWLVSPDDLGGRPHIRKAMRRLVALFDDHRALFAGAPRASTAGSAG